MLDLVKTLTAELVANTGKRPIIKLVFFDGEEAFKDWTNTDSLYGSRHLAEIWEKTPWYGNYSILKSTESFILLDLLGAANPKFYSFFEETTWLFDRLQGLTQKMKEAEPTSVSSTWFDVKRRMYQRGGVQDDHIPFAERGVKALHLIPVPFPSVWHEETDDVDHLDRQSVKDLASLLRLFISEYLQLA